MIARNATPEGHVLTLLDAQRTALLEGDLAGLTTVSTKLERAIAALRQSPKPSQMLRQIAACSKRNAELIASAQRGIARAQNRFSAAKTETLATYGVDGQRIQAGTETGRTLARR